MEDQNAELILNKIKDEKVQVIELRFSDLTGRSKKVEVEADRTEEILKFGQWYDGSSVAGHGRIYESDMRLMPDLSTFAILPSGEQGCIIGRFICDIIQPDDNKPFSGDPRYILKRAISEAKKLGYEYNVGPELEFFLFERDKLPQLVPHDAKGYFDDIGKGRSWNFIRKVMDSLRDFDIKGEYHHHEVAPGQHEIDIRYGQALKMADSVITIKSLMKNLDHAYGLKVSFMPKPIQGINGSGMHVHQSLFTDGQNAFFDEKDNFKLSFLAKNFIAGQLHYARPLCALVASSVNSYKRLVPGYEAPVYVCWGQTNRSALIRVPRYTPGREKSIRLELRCPDPYANPYLALAAMLICGLEGIKEKLEPPAPVNDNVYRLSDVARKKRGITQLPESLKEAVDELLACDLLRNFLGKEVINNFITACQKDIEASRTEVSPWEIERYL